MRPAIALCAAFLLAGCRETAKHPAPAQTSATSSQSNCLAGWRSPSSSGPARPMRLNRPRIAAMSPVVASGRRDVASLDEMRPIDDAYELAVASPGDSEALHAYLDEVDRMLAELTP